MKDKSINIQNKKDCCGCGACFNVCPVNAISMEKDDEGFLFPKVNEEKCINCGLCKKICPFVKKIDNNQKEEIYACHTNNPKFLRKSSSGGIFPEIANAILKENGKIIGVDKENNYIVVNNEIDVEKLYGSKYVQVNTNNIFSQVKTLLDNKETILFVGTPCIINGLKNYLQKNYENLYTCDLVCHGVPSEKWLNYYINSFPKNVDLIDYREKSHGWYNFSVKIAYGNKIKKSLATDNEYMKAFFNNNCLRFSCYSCKAKGKNRLADITLGDYWGVNPQNKAYNFMGTSLMIINSVKGLKLFNLIKNKIVYTKESTNALELNPPYNNSVKMPEERRYFYKDIDKLKFNKFSKKYNLSPKFIRKLKIKIKNILGDD